MAKNSINWWMIGVLAALVIALFLLGRTCGIKSVTKKVGSDTIIIQHTDTVETRPEPQGQIIVDTVIKWLRPKKLIVVDTFWKHDRPQAQITDTLKELERLQLIEINYNQRIAYQDSTKGKTWKAVVYDTVQRNRLTNRKWIVSTFDTLIRNTTTVVPPKRIVVSLSASYMANFNNPFFAQGAGIELKLPNDATYSASLFNVTGHRPMVQIKKTFPLRFKIFRPKK